MNDRDRRNPVQITSIKNGIQIERCKVIQMTRLANHQKELDHRSSIGSEWTCSCFLRKRPQFGEGDRQIFRDRRMNVHGALDDRVRRLRIHHVQQSVNYFIAFDSKNRVSQNLFRFRIDAVFVETLCITFFVGPGHLTHRICRSKPRRPDFRISASVSPGRPSGGSTESGRLGSGQKPGDGQR